MTSEAAEPRGRRGKEPAYLEGEEKGKSNERVDEMRDRKLMRMGEGRRGKKKRDERDLTLDAEKQR